MDFNLIIEKGENGYLIAEVAELPGCHTQAKNMDELILRIREAIKLYLEVEGDLRDNMKSNFLGVKKIEV
jgi:predicted RNase H-like HicB family nuclease